MAKQVTIMIESTSIVVLHARTSGRLWCEGCGREGEVLKLEPRNQAENPAWSVLQKLITRSGVHHRQAPDGSALICLESLMAFIHGRLQSRRHSLRDINTKVEEI